MSVTNKTYTTSDIGIASFLMLKGCVLMSACHGVKGYDIVFDNSDGRCDVLALEYLNSDFIRYDMYSKNLRLMIKNQKR